MFTAAPPAGFLTHCSLLFFSSFMFWSGVSPAAFLYKQLKRTDLFLIWKPHFFGCCYVWVWRFCRFPGRRHVQCLWTFIPSWLVTCITSLRGTLITSVHADETNQARHADVETLWYITMPDTSWRWWRPAGRRLLQPLRTPTSWASRLHKDTQTHSVRLQWGQAQRYKENQSWTRRRDI